MKSIKEYRLIQVMILAVAILFGSNASAQIYVQDGFNYPAGSFMYTNSPWTIGILGNTNLGITVWTNSLAYTNGGQILQGFSPPGYAVLEVNYPGPGSWFVYNEFATNLVLQTTANHAIYTSFLINVQNTPDNAGPPFNDVASGQNNPNCSVMEMGTTNAMRVIGSGSDIALGGGTTAWDFMYDAVNRHFGVEACAAPAGATNWNVDANTYETNLATAWYTNTLIGTNVTYFVVLKFSTTDDSVSLYINPTPGSAEPAPNLVQWGHGAFGSSYKLGYISLNTANGNNQRPPTVVDSLRISTNWADVTPATAAAPASPTITGWNYVSGVGFTLSGNNGPTNGATYSIWATTNLLTPFASWTQLASGQSFDGFGNFSYTDTTATTNQAQYYQLTIP